MIYQSAYFEIREAVGYALVVRSAQAFGSMMEVLVSQDEAIAACRRSAFDGVVVDIRLAPGRFDPAFEDLQTEWRLSLERNFERVAILVSTGEGVAQASRLAEEDEAARTRVFSDFDEAVAYARGA